jgi:hypothetical protein
VIRTALLFYLEFALIQVLEDFHCSAIVPILNPVSERSRLQRV